LRGRPDVITTTSLPAVLREVVRTSGNTGIETQQGSRLHHILRFTLRQSFLDVEQNKFFSEFLTGDIICTGCTYGTCSNYSNFLSECF
jgi:hypothetical protein